LAANAHGDFPDFRGAVRENGTILLAEPVPFNR